MAWAVPAGRLGSAPAPHATRPPQSGRRCGRSPGGGYPGRGRSPWARLDLGPAAGRDPAPRRADNRQRLALSAAAAKGFAWRRPRHTLKGRQDAEAVAASRGRLAELRRQAALGAIDLLFLDEAEARTHPYLAHCWAERGTDLRIEAPGQAKRRALLGAFDPIRHQLRVRTSATKRSADFVGLLDDLAAVYGRSERAKPLVVVLDNGPIHTSKLTTKALAERPWFTLEWLPKYAPELNAIEHRWRDLKRHHLANRTFADADELDRVIHQAVDRLNQERQPHSSASFHKAA
jgi:transposase